jgi:diacylglycerol kinase family enzyme
MKHVFIFDAKIFRNQQWKMDNMLDNIGQFFRTQETDDFAVQFSHYRRDAIGIIQNEIETAKENDTVRIYAIGGNEILYDCINGVAELPNTELVAVPYGGETNDFLRNFGEANDVLFKNIPSSLVQQGMGIPTDIINWGVNYALNSCYIGINNSLMAFDKQTAAQHYKITIDGNDFSGNYCLIHIANGPYYAGKKTGAGRKPGAKKKTWLSAMPDDGLLDVALIKSSGPLRTMWAMRRYLGGKIPSNCVTLQAKEIEVQSDSQMRIQLDNEYIRDTGISIKVVPQAVQMVAMDNFSYQKS